MSDEVESIEIFPDGEDIDFVSETIFTGDKTAFVVIPLPRDMAKEDFEELQKRLDHAMRVVNKYIY